MADDDRSVPDASAVSDAGPTLRFEQSRHPSGATVLHAIGSVDDETSPDLWVEMGIWSEAGSELILDLSRVDFLGTAGLNSLLQSRDMIGAEGKRLRVHCGGSRPARRALQVTGAMDLFDIVDRIPGDATPSRTMLFGVPDPGTRLDGQRRSNDG
ncbi:STAS domain-containing protein [Pseudonocardia spirodelae]|uniref:STAS domain-containing protein n=1 Tax=Pseudonocardia spirodelae TaxID=3133431 RepID=A0ABU8TBP5_9PSEU